MQATTLDSLLALAEIALAAGEEERATYHADGRRETVSTHTMMLGLVACEVARSSNARLALGFPLLDPGLVAQFALVHDVAEVAPGGPGDLDTFGNTDPKARAERDAAEACARALLAESHPRWLGPMVERYERMDTLEARLVHYLDKILPKMTLALSSCRQWVEAGHTLEEFQEFVAKQGAALAERHPDITPICGPLYEALNERVERAWTERGEA